MLKSNGNLGLSEAMIAAAKEILEKKLTPKQEKNIDKNHNGKIDAQDFKLLKNKKMQEEEVEVEFSDAELEKIAAIAQKQEVE